MNDEMSSSPSRDALAPPAVVYFDDALVVVDKPSGMPSVPARTPLDPPAVAVRLESAFGPLEAVHRLDRDTSGILVLARVRAARVTLGIAFEQRRVTKRYFAVVVGAPPCANGTVELPLAQDRERPPRHKVDRLHGRPATTSWRLLALRRALETDPFSLSLMDLEPLTGRSHQLRIHLASLGCPILGDRLYGTSPHDTRCPLALHAISLAFHHPTTGEHLAFTVPPPETSPWLEFTAEITAALAASPSA